MATPGQSTLYKPEYCELAHNDCLPGRHRRGFGRLLRRRRARAYSWLQSPGLACHAGDQDKKVRKARNLPFRPAGIACTDRLLPRLAKALLPVPVISEPGCGTQKFVLLRAEPTGRERCGESRRHAGE
jgi:hypothetical protein